MMPKVGKWYVYDCKCGTGSYQKDIFKIIGLKIDGNEYTVTQYCVMPSNYGSVEKWHVDNNFWNKYVKEIKEKDVMDYIMVMEL